LHVLTFYYDTSIIYIVNRIKLYSRLAAHRTKVDLTAFFRTSSLKPLPSRRPARAAHERRDKKSPPIGDRTGGVEEIITTSNMPHNAEVCNLSEDEREACEERAAIMEYEGGLPRKGRQCGLFFRRFPTG
jgi:hypothetical protein